MRILIMQCENKKYNGWTNWDTWNAYLWLNNDEYLYRTMRRAYSPNNAEKIGTELLKEIGNPDEIDFYEVNWDEIFEAFNEE